jgi:hypothetical protein
MLGYSNISIYYRTMFAMAQHHKYQISELENLMIFERDIYVDMLIDYLESLKRSNNEL